MKRTTTNVSPAELNYDHYTNNQYDRDIVNAIPFHKEIHVQIAEYIAGYKKKKILEILDLGAGTAITSAIIKSVRPDAHFDIIDFSKQMLDGAKKRLGDKNVRYFLVNYTKQKFDKKYDVIVSVIGFHHQTHIGKRKMFKKIYSLLKSDGVFILGDLVTHRDQHTAAHNNALHFHHLVEKSVDEKTLTEWAYHHQFLNDLAPIEDQIDWLKEVGFKVSKQFCKMNTALLIAKKINRTKHI